jgi:predicted ATPase
MNTYTSTEDWAAAVSCGSRILNDLGVPTPRNPTILNVLYLLMKTKLLLNGRKPSDLEELPPMDNPRMEQALFFLGATAFCSFLEGEENRCTVLCLKMFLLTLEFGICCDSPYAFCAYGMCMSHIGEYATAYEYGRLAVKMLDRPGMEKSTAKVMVVVHNYLSYLKDPIQDSLEPLLYGYSSGMRWGDVCQAAFALRARACMGVFAGVHLAEHERYVIVGRN